MPNSNYRCLTLALVLITVTGCGFSLRGSGNLSAELEALHVTLQQPDSEFARLLQRSLEAADVRILTGTAAAGVARLQIGREVVVSRPVSINPRARAAQYEVRVSVEVSLERGEVALIPRQTLAVDRTYFEDIENIAGSREEVEILTTEMRRELVNQLMRRLQAAATIP